jgi:hypothetical protein
MIRKLCLALAIMAMLAAALTTKKSAIASPDMQTITLNTGFNHNTQTKYSIGVLPGDAFWSVIKDPITGTSEPRPANVINKHAAWNVAPANSQWISYSPNGSQALVAGPYYYQKCFCMTKALWDNPEAIQQSSLDVSVMADDFFYLGLNVAPGSLGPPNNLHQLASGGGKGGFVGPPAVWKITGDKLVKLLRPGRNCLTVRVDDIGGVITGFNLVGSLTSTGIDGIAQAVPPGSTPQFNGCSSCSKMKFENDFELKSGAVRDVPGLRPQK